MRGGLSVLELLTVILRYLLDPIPFITPDVTEDPV